MDLQTPANSVDWSCCFGLAEAKVGATTRTGPPGEEHPVLATTTSCQAPIDCFTDGENVAVDRPARVTVQGTTSKR
jgi:hypothetical protein